MSALRLVALLACVCAACGDEQAPSPAPPKEQVDVHELRFAARREWSLGSRPDGLLASDLDGDGHAELVAALRVPGELWLWQGSARGLERTPKKLACGDWPLRPVALPPGSFGAAKSQRFVAVASRAARTLAIWDLAAQKKHFELALDAAPRALAAGRLEPHPGPVIAVVTDEKRLILSERDLGAPKSEPHGGVLPRCAALLADGSGLAIGFQSPSTVEISRPGTPTRKLALPGFPREILELDQDGDGVQELVVAGGDRSVWIFGGGSGDPRELATDAIPLAARAADFDGDGKDELALVHFYDLTAVVWRAGATPERLGRAYAGQTPVDLAAIDADGDEMLDLVVANSNSLSLSFLAGARGALATDARIAVGETPTSITSVDTDGDGQPELAVAASKDEAVYLVDPRAQSVLAQLPIGAQPRALTAADLNGDGRQEVALLVGRERGCELALLWRNQDGTFARREAWPDLVVSQGGADLLLADLTGDGRPEALVADPEARVVAVMHEPAGKPRGPLAPFQTGAPALALAAIELDADTTPEIAVALGAPRAGVALLDVGPDSALHELQFVPVEGAPLDLAAGDLDADGHADLVVLARIAADSIEGRVVPLVRRGAAFETLEAQPTGHNALHVACGDADGDGRADVFVTAQNSHVVNAWRSTAAADGMLLQRLDDIGAGRGCLDLALADLDGYGRLDLAVANAFSDDVSLILGQER